MKLIDLEYRRARRLVRARELATVTPLQAHMQRNIVYRFNLIAKLKVAWLVGTPVVCLTLGIGSLFWFATPSTAPVNALVGLGMLAIIFSCAALLMLWVVFGLLDREHCLAAFERWQTNHRARLAERFEERQRIIARAVELSQDSEYAGAVELVSHDTSPRGKLTLIKDSPNSIKSKYKRQRRTT